MRRKSIYCAVLALAMAASLISCGKKPGAIPIGSPTGSTTTASTADNNGGDDVTTEASTDEVATENQGSASADANYTTAFWSAYVPSAFTENDTYSSDYDSSSKRHFGILEDEKETAYFTVYFHEEDAIYYRKSLLSAGISLEDQASGNYETVNINGVQFAHYESTYWGSHVINYMYRDPRSQFSCEIQYYADAEDDDFKAFINSLTLSLPNNNEVDPPFPSEGEPYISTTDVCTAGSLTITPTQLVMDESFLAMDIFDNRVVEADGDVYVLSDDVLNIYRKGEGTLSLIESFTLDKSYDSLFADENGYVYLSTFGAPMLVYKNMELTYSYADVDYEAGVAPDGSFCLTFFTDTESITKYSLSEGVATEESFSLSEDTLDNVSTVNITENYVVISGKDTATDEQTVFLYDYSGNLVNKLTIDDNGWGIGSITNVVETTEFILALDGNMRNILLWDKSGNQIGVVDVKDLLGTNYPWVSGLGKTADGNFLVSLTDERDDESWDELVVYELNIQ